MRRIEALILVVRNAKHCLRLLAFGIFMVRPKITQTKRSIETNRRQMHKDGTARSLLAAGLIRRSDGAILPRKRRMVEKDVTFRLRRTERFSFPHPFSLVPCDLCTHLPAHARNQTLDLCTMSERLACLCM